MTTTTENTTVTGAVGSARTRVEGRDKVTGAARYAGEIPFAELAHGWLVLSTVPRGRIRSVEDAPVRGMPGVLAVLHHENAPRVDTAYLGMLGPPNPVVGIFQHDRVPFMGWPVALVVAETSEEARAAADALVVRYDEEPHDVRFFAGHAGVYTPDEKVMAQADTEKGDLAARLREAAHVVDEEYSTRRSTTTRWSRTPRRPAGRAAGWTSSTPTRAPVGWPPNSRRSSPSTRHPSGCAPSMSAEASDRRACPRTRWRP